MRKQKIKGFTLIEILVALMIFAIMGVLAAMSLRSMIRTHNALQKTDKSLTQLQVAMVMMRRDFSQIIDRPIINSDGQSEAAFIVTDNGVVFTRAGLQNPLNIARKSNMQRMGYALEGNQLVRLTWDVLDQPPAARPEKQVLLDNVADLQWQFVTQKNQLVSSWPPAAGSNLQKESLSVLPRAVDMVMHIKNHGVVEGVFPIPSRGVVNATVSSQ